MGGESRATKSLIFWMKLPRVASGDSPSNTGYPHWWGTSNSGAKQTVRWRIRGISATMKWNSLVKSEWCSLNSWNQPGVPSWHEGWAPQFRGALQGECPSWPPKLPPWRGTRRWEHGVVWASTFWKIKCKISIRSTNIMIRDTAGESQNLSLSLTKTNTDIYEFCNLNGWKDHEEDAKILFDGN